MYRALSNDVTPTEMMELRNQGMTNKEIAQSLDCCYKTVLKMIGKQPPELRSEYVSRAPVSKAASLPKPRAEEVQEDIPAALLVEDRIISLIGQAGSYTVSTTDKLISASLKDVANLSISFDQLPETIEKFESVVKELRAIERKMKSLTMSMEAW